MKSDNIKKNSKQQKNTQKTVGQATKRKMTNKEKAEFSSQNTVDFYPIDTYND